MLNTVTMLLAAGVLGLLAVVVACVLGWANRAFHVTVDPKILALIDALRGEWFAQAFADGGRGAALGEATIVTPSALIDWAPCRLTGFGLAALPDSITGRDDVEIASAGALAPTLLARADEAALEWDPATLVEPLYLRPPAATPSRP